MAKEKRYKVTKRHYTRLSSMQVDARLRAAGIPANGQSIRQVSATEFRRAILRGKANYPKAKGWMVDVHSISEYRNYKCYLTADGKAGLAIHTGKGRTPKERAHKGDVVSLFAAEKGTNAMGKLIPFAVANGGRKLDCYGDGLQDMYARYGARATGRVLFSEDALGEDTEWEPSFGRPDVIAMTLPSSLDEVIKSYKPKVEINFSKVHLYKGEGEKPYNKMIADRDKQVDTRRTGSTEKAERYS